MPIDQASVTTVLAQQTVALNWLAALLGVVFLIGTFCNSIFGFTKHKGGLAALAVLMITVLNILLDCIFIALFITVGPVSWITFAVWATVSLLNIGLFLFSPTPTSRIEIVGLAVVMSSAALYGAVAIIDRIQTQELVLFKGLFENDQKMLGLFQALVDKLGGHG